MTSHATYRGTKPNGAGRNAPSASPSAPKLARSPPSSPNGATDRRRRRRLRRVELFVDLPRTPKELFDGDYERPLLWNNRIDPDDPSYVLSELNKFQHGAQSLERRWSGSASRRRRTR
jgi:hypothetical protein